MDKENEKTIDRLSNEICRYNINAIDCPNVIVLREDVAKLINLTKKLEQDLKKKQDVIDKIKEWEQNHTILVYTKNAPRELVGTHELLHLLYEDKEVE